MSKPDRQKINTLEEVKSDVRSDSGNQENRGFGKGESWSQNIAHLLTASLVMPRNLSLTTRINDT